MINAGHMDVDLVEEGLSFGLDKCGARCSAGGFMRNRFIQSEGCSAMSTGVTVSDTGVADKSEKRRGALSYGRSVRVARCRIGDTFNRYRRYDSVVNFRASYVSI